MWSPALCSMALLCLYEVIAAGMTINCFINPTHASCESTIVKPIMSEATTEELVTREPKAKLVIVFTESFIPSNEPKWNGETYRKKKGLSGSHAAAIYLSEAFASLGHFVYFMADSVEVGAYKGVHYIQPDMVTEIDCDVLITTNNMMDLMLLTRFPFKVKKVLMTMHNDPLLTEGAHTYVMSQYHPEKYAFMHVSEFTKANVLFTQQWIDRFEQQVLYNSIDIDEIPLPIDFTAKKKHFVFFACLERGGEISFQTATYFPDFEFHTITYAFHHSRKTIQELFQVYDEYKQLVILSNGSKDMIYQELRIAKYFVYPIVNIETLQIHYDTFGYVVLEALLHGVVVIAPRMGCFEELFDDAIAYVEVDDLLPAEYLTQWRHAFPDDPDLFAIYCDRFHAKVEELESNETLYLQHAMKGISLRKKFTHLRIGRMLESYLYRELHRLEQLQEIRKDFTKYHQVFTMKV
jgi:hypothetical protein